MTKTKRKIFFYPHKYLRDRQIDTVKHWPKDEILNASMFHGRTGDQVPPPSTLQKNKAINWKQLLPLINIKRRPKGIKSDSAVYVWGGLIATGEFIVDIDNPYAFTAYNVFALKLWKPIIKRFLLSNRCLEIRCMSKACKASIHKIFGESVSCKTVVYYPISGFQIREGPVVADRECCNFLFVGTQFELKGGQAMLSAFNSAQLKDPSVRLDIITHLPERHQKTIEEMNGVTVHKASFTRDEIINNFISNADVLLHPSYLESFGMIIAEAISKGLAVVANDIYAIREMVVNEYNGILLTPPITKWNGVMPNKYFMQKKKFINAIIDMDCQSYVENLTESILALSLNKQKLVTMKNNSLHQFEKLIQHNRAKSN